MIVVLKEVTDWEYPGHTYFVDTKTSKLLAYIKSSGTEKEVLKRPLPFSKTGRKFIKLGAI